MTKRSQGTKPPICMLVDGTPSHAPVLAAIHGSCFPESWDQAALLELLKMPGAFSYLAVVDGMPIGFILCRQSKEEGEIITLGVLPSYRRQGIAGRLLQQAEDFVCRNKGEEMFLEVAADNVPAQDFYGSFGYREVGRRPNYYRTPQGNIDALILKAALPKPR